ncbi:hypothetical protein [Methylobacterium brachiatum]|jgi:hypothetical protein|uniref:hypothetical protein n=1 Tax=Methylobacterium brachiatum TaxID=269660 RepID=UPI00244AADFF|nr:hypothetical protein [Methylobacterium brachiatum]MDH2312409.1 hypothetical protein [Methylobacterium brachiatum]
MCAERQSRSAPARYEVGRHICIAPPDRTLRRPANDNLTADRIDAIVIGIGRACAAIAGVGVFVALALII